jgi:hypothetical protein
MAGYTVSSVTSGKYARQVTVAASGPQGAQGPAGPQGIKGDTGTTGGLSARFKFLNSYSASDPGVGYLAFNNSVFLQSSELYISKSDVLADDQSAFLTAIVASTSANKSVVTFQKVSDPRKISRFYVTGGSDNAGWWDFQITYIGGTALNWTYNELVDVLVAPVGDLGAVGPTGPRGETGPGVPAGGLSGQILRKTSNSDYATEWVDPESVQNVSLTELTDIDLSSLSDGQVLVYDEETGTWIPTSPESLPQSTGALSGTIEGGSASTF